MSYTPEDQCLEPHIEQIISGIRGFNAATCQRLANAREWKAEYLKELISLRSRMGELEAELILLNQRTR